MSTPMDEWMDYSDFVDKVQELIDLGFYDDALKMLDEYSHLHHDEWEVYFLYSRIYTEQNHPEDAIPYLHKGLRLDKTNVDCLVSLFYAYSMMNQVRKGAKYLLRAYKLHPDNEMVMSSLIWYYSEINDTSTAIDFFTRLHDRGTTNPETYRNGGLAYERAGQHENAEHCFKTALELNPSFEEARDLLADHYMILEQFDKATELYQEALKESPRNIRILSRLVFCYSQSNQIEQALSLARETIRMYPNSPIGYVDLSYVYLNTNEFDKAIESANTAIDISPIDPEAFRVLGIAYSEKSDFENANTSFQKAISLDGNNPEIIRDYYHYLRNAGKFELMEKWVHTVIEIEYPHCMEDFWFLADFYREKGNNLKAFHYLKKAYKAIPAEKELIPPMVEILLEEGHTRYTLPFLIKYVEKNGWNEVMNEFAQHERLKGKWSQEGIRFLRFWGQRSTEYRKFIFRSYLRKMILVSSLIISLLAIIPVYLLYKMPGIIIMVLSIALLTGIYFLLRILSKKNFPFLRKLNFVF
ncbi:MAG: tetratricopeptide repeat protein [Fibrobacter sp.]|nr:tetratricopeptide repeat protein [Fibrobacter sp.]